MIGGLMKTTSLAALVAIASAMTLSATANAADLGGNCCADLEERVAELEATTARKGNRKVKLTVSGQVNEAVLFWDDGAETNAYVVSNNSGRTRFRFVGDAKIDNDWSAGYLLEIGARYASTTNRSQLSTNAGGNTNSLDIRHSAWYLDSKTFGRLWVGKTSTATDGITEINLSNIVNAGPDMAAAWSGGGFRFRRSGTTGQAGLSGLNIITATNQISSNGNVGEGDRNNVVRYVSPTFKGFTFSAAWGEDDMWDTALRYAGEFNGIRLAAGIGYRQSRDINTTADGLANCANLAGTNNQSAVDCNQLGLSISVMHVPTGLYLAGSYGEAKDKNRKALFGVGGLNTAAVDDKESFYYIQGGLERKFTSLGLTTVYAEYYSGSFGSLTSAGAVFAMSAQDAAVFGGAAGDRIQGLDMTVWGLGINQQIEAAAMDLYLSYRNYSFDMTRMSATNTAVTKTRPLDDFQAVMMGGIIRF